MTPGVMILKRGAEVETVYSPNVQELVSRFRGIQGKPGDITEAEILSRRGLIRSFRARKESRMNPLAALSPEEQQKLAQEQPAPKKAKA